MAKQNKVGADDLGWKFVLYHVSWITALVALFVLLDFWIFCLIFAGIGFYFFKYY